MILSSLIPLKTTYMLQSSIFESVATPLLSSNSLLLYPFAYVTGALDDSIECVGITDILPSPLN